MKSKPFAVYTWGVLVFTLAIIVWGAFVRATGSGAGCGNHWPTCHGEVVPRSLEMETLIEFTHRFTGALGGLMVIGLVGWAYRLYPRRHPVRLGAMFSLVFFIIEGLLGAGLVRFELVVDNASLTRAVAMGIHLVNTFVLLTFMTLTSWWASGGEPVRVSGQSQRLWSFGIGLLLVTLLGSSGAVTALGDTLFPDESLIEGLRQDLSPTVHALKRLRVVHPFIGLLTGLYLALLGVRYRQPYYPKTVRRLASALLAVFGLQFIIGVVNVILLAPVWIQLVHLFMADLVWMLLVLLAASVLREQAPITETIDKPTTLPANQLNVSS